MYEATLTAWKRLAIIDGYTSDRIVKQRNRPLYDISQAIKLQRGYHTIAGPVVIPHLDGPKSKHYASRDSNSEHNAHPAAMAVSKHRSVSDPRA